MNFSDGKFLKAKEKENIYKAMERFIKSDFDQSKFTSNLYKYLSLHFGFIAHYNAVGFFEARFEDPDGRIQTYKQIEEASPWEFKDENTSACADLNRAIVDLVKANKAKFTEDAYTKKIKSLRDQQADINDELERITGLKKVTGSVSFKAPDGEVYKVEKARMAGGRPVWNVFCSKYLIGDAYGKDELEGLKNYLSSRGMSDMKLKQLKKVEGAIAVLAELQTKYGIVAKKKKVQK